MRIFDVLDKALLRFTQPGAFNDPFEMSPHFHSWGEDGLSSSDEQTWKAFEKNFHQKYLKLPPEIRKRLPYEYYPQKMQISKTKMLKQYNDLASIAFKIAPKMLSNKIQSSWDKQIGILCLAEKSDNLLMWAHYCGNHTGFIVGFDVGHPFFDQRKSQKDFIRYLAKVAYSPTRPKVSISEMKNFEIFLIKSPDWAYEQEWRMILPLSEATEKKSKDPSGFDICLFSIPLEAIKQVIMGCRMTAGNRAEIKRLVGLHSNRVELSEFVLHETEFSLKLKKIIMRPKISFPKVLTKKE